MIFVLLATVAERFALLKLCNKYDRVFLLGHEIAFYEGEILLGQPVKKHLFKSVCTMYIFVRNSERRRRDFWRMEVTYLRAETKV